MDLFLGFNNQYTESNFVLKNLGFMDTISPVQITVSNFIESTVTGPRLTQKQKLTHFSPVSVI